jgi:3-oxoacyl-[acyl-carrier protein] reductase
MAASGTSLAGKVALVTGGSNGIGRAAVRILAAEGASVIIGYNKGRDRAESVMAELPGSGHRVQQLTLEDAASIAAAAEATKAAYGKLDVLVNSAGFTRPVPHNNLDGLDDALFDAIMVANVRGPFAMTRAFRGLLEAGGDSVIVNVSSIAAFTGSGSNIAYCASKAALDTMTISLARVLGPKIRVMGVSPGAVATDFVAGRGRPELEKLAQATPLKKIVEPEDVAMAIMACVTHLKATTGSYITVDAGRFLA